MKTIVFKICAMFMAIVVLFSTMSFTFDMHYCGDDLVDVSLFKKAKSCGMEKAIKSTSAKKECSVSKKNCCSDKQQTVTGQDELQQFHIDKLSFKQQLFVATFVHTYLELFESVQDKNDEYREYSPPLFVRPIYKFDETYLI
ncbi:HYC_CC_PP family protein [Mangrovimonas aestuarii]|uniref:HYC_CC_PP family protein n=1 Tax=Mangrovimonas aestuarii TaxID=3018443 RepID=UPI002377E82B|nr:hypothetical protein [Mangrovimonas aestuarii]